MATLPAVLTVSRTEFLDHRWSYRPGEHVTMLGYTGCGKTTLAYDLMQRTAHNRLPAVVLVVKPKDKVVRDLSKRAGYRTVQSWPPTPTPWHPRRPGGYVLWPKHTFDPDVDDARLWSECRRAILHSYKRGNRIMFADEVYGLVNELKLQRELVAVWSRGRSMGTGLWVATQKPTHIPLWAYSQAEHLFIWHDSDDRARKRYAEIGGVDSKLVERTVWDLGHQQVLYIRRRDRVMCVIDRQ